MPAYVLVDITITDPESYQTYITLTPASIAAYGGKFLVRGGAKETLEGEWQPQRMVVLEFPTVEIARTWWDSPEYAEAKAIRQRSAHTNMLLLEGYAG